MQPLLKLSNIKRNYGAIKALRGANFEIMPGEVMGLVGENGAGKSTMVKIISGFDSGFEGEYLLNGEQLHFTSPIQAERAGIAVAQQELSLIKTMSVAENIFLAGDSVPTFATKYSLARNAKPYLEEVGLGHIDPLTSTDRLSVGEQHLIEVARLLAHDPQILILDEPTAALGETDSIRILNMVNRLSKRGKSIIYVSHRMDEIFKISDRIIVLRDGESQEPRLASDLNVNTLVELMLGRELNNMYPKRTKKKILEPVMKVRNLWPDRLLEGVNFNINRGEILGLAGQLGSGTGDILAAIAGATRTRDGQLTYKGKTFLPKNPKEAIEAGIAYCSDDRKHDGLFLGRPISDNLSAAALHRIAKNGIRSPSSETKMVTENAVKFTVDPARLPQEAGVLSGGNQQKVALAKWLAINPDIILINEPTRGVDVGARAEIYQKLRELADEGAAIVVASTDIQEITNLPDRIITVYRGIQIGEIALGDMSAATILEEITNPFREEGLQGENSK
ncbi:MAG: sugar ABC transporter ATP-binding protein [Amylibacter sp.]|jgi:ABC-type sugar transport system ATPase subunit|tara:strand:- start:16631 stop:18151 length:1521 start_codon:yes stop_codon:yes gene_type:complete